MKEPTRLCDGEELPPALRAAFRSLDQGAPSAETALRVQRALQALPAVAPGASTAGAFGLTKLALVATLFGGAVSAVVLVGVRGSAPRETSEAHVAREVDVRAPAQSAQAVDDDGLRAQPAGREPETSAAPEPKAQAASSQRAPNRDLSETGGATTQARAPADFVAPAQDRPGSSSVTNARTAMRALVLPSAPRTRAVERARAPAHVAGEAEPTPAMAVVDEPERPAASARRAPEAQANEATLLAQAKRLAASDAAEALRRVEALALQYPQGLFVQERELLAIQLHRRLGHSVLAEQLVQRFRERYPNSVYRRTLAP